MLDAGVWPVNEYTEGLPVPSGTVGWATVSYTHLGDAKSFDRVARKWNVDYAFYKTGPDKYLSLIHI